MLSSRVLTAIVGIPVVWASVYYSSVSFCCMMFVVSFMCVKEYLFISKKYNPRVCFSLVMAVMFFLFLCSFKNFHIDKVALSAIVMMFVFFGIEIFGESPDLCVGRISTSFLGSFFIPLAFIHMVYIRNLHAGMKLVFFLFLVVWILDTAAYVFGKMFGKHKLAKNVSPKKTMEGAIAGVVFGVLTALICRCVFMKNILTFCESIVLGFVIAIVGQFSDFAESIIKRDGDIKDSGKVIPGHGGFFDRFDSYMFAAPVMYYVLQFFQCGKP
ncbi:MAG: phosphatidate cytidylyltransferase [Endomicrobium sp.]|jgi:phosphatidate cytidylyltransferase|nr:phosphatidate cytidylyltransferase [Endomicrobium sp.]